LPGVHSWGAIWVGACGHAGRETVIADVRSLPHSRVEPALLHQWTSCEGMGVACATFISSLQLKSNGTSQPTCIGNQTHGNHMIDGMALAQRDCHTANCTSNAPISRFRSSPAPDSGLQDHPPNQLTTRCITEAAQTDSCCMWNVQSMLRPLVCDRQMQRPPVRYSQPFFCGKFCTNVNLVQYTMSAVWGWCFQTFRPRKRTLEVRWGHCIRRAHMPAAAAGSNPCMHSLTKTAFEQHST
jgi:hypothetical protein